ncbi:hypothetical protein F4808DRAFT_405552 [Astrocystis sublimbata]|nr:hypothetical protein F4808DRAFT_405552 [Astrocystis sublimbata]
MPSDTFRAEPGARSSRRASNMASLSAPATADTLITLKINFDGTTRRFKLPLKDLGSIITFENKVRAFLDIPEGTTAIIERYSDSATTFVTLSNANVSVYKQLYRAAKAKLKLKLRVTTIVPEPVDEVSSPHVVGVNEDAREHIEAFTGPKPVTIEDAPEDETRAASSAQVAREKSPDTEASSAPAEETPDADIMPAPQTGEDVFSFIKEWRTRGNPRIHLKRNANGEEVIKFLGPCSSSEPMVTREGQADAPDPLPTSLAELLRGIGAREASRGPKPPRRFVPQSVKDLVAKSAAAAKAADAKSAAELLNEAQLPGFHMDFLEPMKAKKCTAPIDHLQSFEATKAPALAAEASDPIIKGTEPTELALLQNEYMKRPFTVCCNSCDQSVPEAHFHCSICDEGDFDLCQQCVDRGITCYGDGHWLIKRTVVNGDIKCSSTQIAPKSARPTKSKPSPSPNDALYAAHRRLASSSPCKLVQDFTARTCNCCVQEFREEMFVHCTTCDDYDLCKTCFAKDQHGHHPNHGFDPAVKDTVFNHLISSQMEPGRNVLHNAICDGCDKYVRGIRHKCLDCPDWDYCSDCVKEASFIHANHRFVAIYEPLGEPFRTNSRATHYGISCDGPLCSARDCNSRYIQGVRYKCAVCHDTDFCANCEASPANTHNKTHPLIKFKTPVRHVSVTTTGEHEDGQRLPTMGDRAHAARSPTHSHNHTSTKENIVATPVQTVVNVQPTEQMEAVPVEKTIKDEFKDEVTEAVAEECEVKQETSRKSPALVKLPPSSHADESLKAVFKCDTIQDGSILPPNITFEQTWVLRNEGTVPWPAGCAVKFVGGDYMGAVDPSHPAGIHELVSASESTVCYNSLRPGQEFPFTVLMRTPKRDGKVISYWRLTTPDGVKFGNKLWCDVTVETPAETEQIKAEVPTVAESNTDVEENEAAAIEGSRMIIPKLDHESPASSIHEVRSEVEIATETETLAPSAEDDDDFEDCGGVDDWADDSDDGFLTDEEYDILDASDEEFLLEQQSKIPRK